MIVQKAPRSNVPSIDKHKFLVPNDISIAQLMWIIRKRIQLAPEKAIFLFVGKVLPQSRYFVLFFVFDAVRLSHDKDFSRFLNSASMSTIYEEYADDDGFLYIMYSGESTFGC